MKNIITAIILSMSLIAAPAMADDVKTKEVKVCYHPIPLAVGVVVGVLTGGLGGLVVGAVLGEGTARVVENGSLKCEK
jgi:hypothetical protein